MIINNSSIQTEAEAYKARIIGDAIVNAFGAHRINFSDFSNDFSGVYGSAGSTIRVPLIGKTGGVKTANADGTDDFSIGTKSTEYVDLELSLKYVTAPLTIGEMETGAQLSDWATSLANDVVEDVQKTLEDKLIAGVDSGKVQSFIVGGADSFTAADLTKKVRPLVRKGAGVEPVVYLEGGHYASVIPMDKDGFDPATPHFGFSKIAEYTSFNSGVCGFAANQSAVAVATRIPQSLMNNPAYITKYAYQLPELGINVMYAEWANPNNGTMTAGIFYLCGMEVAKENAAVVLKNS
jgi:hypothetical protein